MKKLTLILAILSLLTACLGGLTVGAAGPMDAFTEIEAPDVYDRIWSSSDNYFQGMNQLTDPVGQWNWADTFEGKDGCWGMNLVGTYMDCDSKIIFWETKDNDYEEVDATTVSALVFADIFTQSGVSEFGRIRVKPDDFEQLTVVYSDDGENWSSVDFTYAYYTEAGTFTNNSGKSYTVDTYWVLTFTEEIPAVKYFGIHTAETRAWDAADYNCNLGILLAKRYTYLVKGSGEVGAPVAPPVTVAPETNAPETNAPETNAPETGAPETNAPETSAPETNEPEAPAENDMTWLYIVIAAAVVVVVIVVLIVAKKKKS